MYKSFRVTGNVLKTVTLLDSYIPDSDTLSPLSPRWSRLLYQNHFPNVTL